MTNPDQDKNQDQDLIDMIAKATPDTPVNEDHRAALRRQVLDAYDQRDAGNEPTRNPLFKITGATAMKLAASFALLTAIGIVAVTALTPSKAIAFEDVANEIIKIETASFDLAQAIAYPDGRSLDLGTYTVTMQMPDLIRTEMPNGITMIIDTSRDKMLMLVTANRIAMVIDGINAEFNQGQEQTRFLGDIQDHLERAVKGKKLDDIKYEKLGEKQIGETKAIGYRVLSLTPANEGQKAEEDAGAAMQGFDIWADAETGLIVLLQFKTPAAQDGTATYTYENFIYNQQIDPKLLSMQIPDGFMLVDPQAGALAGLPEPQESKGTLPMLIEFISLYAVENDGLFPDALKSQIIKDHLTEQWKSENPDKPVYKNKDQGEYTDPMLGQVHALIDDAFAFVRQLEADGIKYTYAGKGVKLGDGKTPILWFKAKDAQTYTVVYGDMQVKQADTPPGKP